MKSIVWNLELEFAMELKFASDLLLRLTEKDVSDTT